MSEVRWTVFPTEDAKCFGCGRFLRKSAHWKQVQKGVGLHGDPRFVFKYKGKDIHVCPMCAMLCAMKDNGDQHIRENEFNERTMANIHRKHMKELCERRKSGVTWMTMLQEMFPQIKD